MAGVRNAQLFSLSEFVRAHWEPILQSASHSANDDLDELFILCKWIDAVGWVVLGIDLAVYDQESARNLLTTGRFRMVALYERHSRELRNVIPAHALVKIEELLGSGKISRGADFAEPVEDLHSYFFTGESLSQLLNQDTMILRYRRLVLTLDRKWPSGPISVDVLGRLLSEDTKPSDDFTLEEAIVASIRCVSAMALWNDLFRELRLAEQIAIGNREGLRRRMSEINGWRFGFDRTNIQEKFKHLAELLQCIFVDLRQSEMGVTLDSKILASNIEDVIDQWQNDHPFHLSYQASH